MFSLTIIDSDAFLDMPSSAQNLYFHLSMRADDDGFINNPKKIQLFVGASSDDLKILIAKKFIICFESGVIVIKHWKIHNYIANDRYHPTSYQEEKSQLLIKKNRSYTLPENVEIAAMYTECIQDVDADKNRLDKNRLDKNIKHKYGEYKNVLLTDEQLEKLKAEFPDYKEKIEILSEGIELKGYKYKNHLLAIKKWAKKDKENEPKKSNNPFLDKLREEEELEQKRSDATNGLSESDLPKLL